MRQKILSWALVVLWMAVIFAFSAQTGLKVSDTHQVEFLVKKTAHVIVYSILTILVIRAMRVSVITIKIRYLLLTILIVSLYAISDEIHQSFVPGREPAIRDVVIDTMAAIVVSTLHIRPRRL